MLNTEAQSEGLWNDPAKAQAVMRERTQLEKAIGDTRSIERELEDAVGLIELGEAEGDQSVVEEAEKAIFALKPMADQTSCTVTEALNTCHKSTWSWPTTVVLV